MTQSVSSDPAERPSDLAIEGAIENGS